ncbi:nacht and wd40 domain protein [uncultured Mediterranean phage]|nr:nacht and wd40 domain protein [uncultured Mediterranean phage]
MTAFDKAWGVLKALPEQRVDLISPYGDSMEEGGNRFGQVDKRTIVDTNKPSLTGMYRGDKWTDAEPSRTRHPALNPRRIMGKVDPRLGEGTFSENPLSSGYRPNLERRNQIPPQSGPVPGLPGMFYDAQGNLTTEGDN